MNPDTNHDDYHEAMRKGQQAYSARVKADGLRGDTRIVRCMISPGDKLNLTRVGPVGGQSTHVVVAMTVHGEDAGTIMLSPANARRLTAALLDLIEECDPSTPLIALPELPNGGEN